MADQVSLAKNLIPDETSRRISSLRFLLIVLVVFIHNNYEPWGVAESIANGDIRADFVFNPSAVSVWIQFFISQGIARCAVPLFFMFSAYLQFKKDDSCGTLLRKKSRTLVLPYFLWIALNIVLVVCSKLAVRAVMPSLLNNPDKIPFVSDFSAMEWIRAFLGDYSDWTTVCGPYLGQMWFMRDLFIMTLLSPVLKKAARRFPVETLLFASFFFVCGIRPVAVHSQALLFYTLGFFWAERGFDLFAFADKCRWKAILPVFALFTVIKFFTAEQNGGDENPAVNALMVFSAMLSLLKFSSVLCGNEKVFAATKYLAGFSFFLFAAHMPFVMNCIETVWLKVFPMKNAFFCLFEYFGVTLVNIAVCTGCGILLKKIFPKLFAVLNGGR